MSALGQKQTSDCRLSMSALPPKADIRTKPRNVRFVPEAEVAVILRSIRQSKNVSKRCIKKIALKTTRTLPSGPFVFAV
jgi:hypothetical protein